jgi:hypothetical protein
MPAIAPGIRGQTHLDDWLDFSGTIASGGTAQLVLNQQPRRTSLLIANTSATDTITVGIGPATGTPTLSSGTVASIAVANAGIGYVVTPIVRILGGLIAGDLQQCPQHPAAAHVTLSTGTIASFVIDDPGSGYLVAPYIYLENPLPRLGGGALLPSATVGIPLPAGWNFSTSGMMIVPTSAVAIYGPTNGNSFVVKVGGLV